MPRLTQHSWVNTFTTASESPEYSWSSWNVNTSRIFDTWLNDFNNLWLRQYRFTSWCNNYVCEMLLHLYLNAFLAWETVDMTRESLSLFSSERWFSKYESIIFVPKKTVRKNLSRASMLCAKLIHSFSMNGRSCCVSVPFDEKVDIATFYSWKTMSIYTMLCS